MLNLDTENWYDFFGVSEETYDKLISITIDQAYVMATGDDTANDLDLIKHVIQRTQQEGIEVSENVLTAIVKMCIEVSISMKGESADEALVKGFIVNYQRENGLNNEVVQPPYDDDTRVLLQGMMGTDLAHGEDDLWSDVLGVDADAFTQYVEKAYLSVRHSIGSSYDQVNPGTFFRWIMSNVTSPHEAVVYAFLAGRVAEEYDRDSIKFLVKCIMLPNGTKTVPTDVEKFWAAIMKAADKQNLKLRDMMLSEEED